MPLPSLKRLTLFLAAAGTLGGGQAQARQHHRTPECDDLGQLELWPAVLPKGGDLVLMATASRRERLMEATFAETFVLTQGKERIPLQLVKTIGDPASGAWVLHPSQPLSAGVDYDFALPELHPRRLTLKHIQGGTVQGARPSWSGAPELVYLSACHQDELAYGCPVGVQIHLPVSDPKMPFLVHVKVTPDKEAPADTVGYETLMQPWLSDEGPIVTLTRACSMNVLMKPGIRYFIHLSLMDASGQEVAAPKDVEVLGDPKVVPYPDELPANKAGEKPAVGKP